MTCCFGVDQIRRTGTARCADRNNSDSSLLYNTNKPQPSEVTSIEVRGNRSGLCRIWLINYTHGRSISECTPFRLCPQRTTMLEVLGTSAPLGLLIPVQAFLGGIPVLWYQKAYEMLISRHMKGMKD